MGKNNKTQEQLIKTSLGHQYVGTYAGTLGDADYYVCKDQNTGRVLGYVATVVSGKFGPMCSDYLSATIRARNVATSCVPWWTRLLFGKHK